MRKLKIFIGSLFGVSLDRNNERIHKRVHYLFSFICERSCCVSFVEVRKPLKNDNFQLSYFIFVDNFTQSLMCTVRRSLLASGFL